MLRRTRARWLGGLACGAFLALSAPAMAIPITGTAAWTGVATFTTSGVLSFCAAPGPCPTVPAGPPGWNIVGSGTGDLAPYGGDILGGTMSTLSSATNPVGVTLATPSLFVSFATPSPGVTDIQFFMQTVFAGVGGIATCTSAPAPGQTCTPAGSAFTFLNGAGGNSSGTITAQGFARHVSDGPGFAAATPLQMIFTLQFSQPYQTVLANFASAGSFTSTYSANFSTPTAAVPEPGTWLLLGTGLAAILGVRRRTARPGISKPVRMEQQ